MCGAVGTLVLTVNFKSRVTRLCEELCHIFRKESYIEFILSFCQLRYGGPTLSSHVTEILC